MQGNDLEAKSREGEEDCSKYIVLCTWNAKVPCYYYAAVDLSLYIC